MVNPCSAHELCSSPTHHGHNDLYVVNGLCTGTYGTVYKARDNETGEIVALKVVRLDEDDEVYNSMYNKNDLQSCDHAQTDMH